MKFKRLICITIPVVSLIVGGALLSTGSESNKAPIATQAADYSTSARDFKLNQDGSVSATFTVSDSELDMQGWLLCLLDEKPDYNLDSRKLVDSNNIHPYNTNSDCVHYFYVENTSKTGKVSITWSSDAADQKSGWTQKESTDEENNLAKYMSDATDYYIVIGPRHYRGSWKTSEEIGAGKDHIWENCDYYVGRKSNLLNNTPEGQTYLDLTDLPQYGDNAKLAVYYWIPDSSSGWSEWAVESSEFENIYTVQYCLDFVPTNMQIYRFNPDATVPSMGNYVYNYGKNETFFEFGVIGVALEYPTQAWDGRSWANALASVDLAGKKSVILDHYKRNAYVHSEHYNQTVFLEAGDEFVMNCNGGTYTSYSIYSSLSEYFAVVNNKIHVYRTGGYALYFDTNVNSLYITSPAIAQADEWSELFLGNSCAETKSSWTTNESRYDDLCDEAKAFLSSISHYSHDEQVTGWTNLAMQRYDFLVQFFGYDDYISRSGKWTPNNANEAMKIFSSDNATTTLTVIVTASLCAAAIGALFIVKKKRVSK